MHLDCARLPRRFSRRIENAAGRTRIVERELCYREVHNGVITSGRHSAGVYYKGKIVEGSRLHRQNAGEPIPPQTSTVRLVDEDVLFIGVFHSCWGHCITDELKHLWFVLNGLPEQYRLMRKVYCTLVLNDTLPTNFFEMLLLLGINLADCTRIDSPTQFRKVVIPDECFFTADKPSPEIRFVTQEYNQLIELLRKRAGIEACVPSRRVFFSTTKFKSWDVGANLLDDAFTRAGFEVISPEELSFADMLRLLGQVKVFASAEGSCAHNSVFLFPGTEVVLLCKVHDVYWHQIAITKLRELNVTYFDVGFSNRFLRYERHTLKLGPFFVWSTRQLSDFLGIDSSFPLCAFVRYLAWSFTLSNGHWFCDWLRRLVQFFRLRQIEVCS